MPPLLPKSTWGKAALALLLVATLCRSLAYASSQPALFAPDEDYHYNYVQYLITQHRPPRLNGRFDTIDASKLALFTRQTFFLQGAARSDYRGDPKAVLARLAKRPHTDRLPAGAKPRQVLHAPGWHIGAVIVDRALDGKDAITRLTAMRYWSALLGALGVFFAWLLAAQVLTRTWEQLAAAALLTLQPLAAFSAATLTNDVLVTATFTATLAWCAFMLRTIPSRRQGFGLGIAFAAALLSKSTSIALVALIAVTLAALWRMHPAARGEIRGLALRAAATTTVLAGWWYAYVIIKTHTLLGGSASFGGDSPGTHSLTFVPHAIYDWFATTYPGYWFEYIYSDVTTRDVWFYIPLVVGLVGIAGLAARLWPRRRTLLSPAAPELRQSLLLLSAAAILVLPPLAIDVARAIKMLNYVEAQPRFLIPAFPGLAVLFVLGLRALTREHRRIYPLAVGSTVVLGAVFYAHTYLRWGLERFYGALDGHPGRLLAHASFDKPTWVGPTWFWVLFAIWVVTLAAAFAITAVGARRERAGALAGASEPLLPAAR